ncbi:hypothetical protein [Paraburkholderia megapolitana]|uniref:Uncharacterized protein n=1 Tax=Paraburkholderia megapolitana TaxID=420953 RepID=A0A1I3S9U2_9BURK|nr:hypothetical protein [Paraburkholderia megapolitana]QDQ85796.1 hypothetical protein FNZ07_33005 [Paraburkholderia megapolitana]SFJ55584.1 hypothetical protein SAMN05192543_108106 [Paraburkholderia megapolitana]
MKTSDHIKHSLDALDKQDMDQAMLYACLAIDGTAKKTYLYTNQVGLRFRKFINDNIDIVELMFGGINLVETLFPFKDSKGKIGVTFADIVYEKFRCSLAHGDELPDGFDVTVQIADGHQIFAVDIKNQSMTLPQSAITGLGLICVLAPVNAQQKIGNNAYRYWDRVNTYVVDAWWGKVDAARAIMDFKTAIRVKMDFKNVWPTS